MSTPATNRQVPDQSIMDHFGKQVYIGNSFIFPINGISLPNNTETPVALIKNPATTSSTTINKALFFRKLEIAAGGIVYVRYYINPTITVNGGAFTPLNLRPANPQASIATCFTGPTIAANGTLYSPFGSSSDLLLILDAGKTLLITYQYPGAGTITANSSTSWYEL